MIDQDKVSELAAGIDARLGRQIDFILELDQLKTVIRRSRLTDGSRYENTAEHSWHLAMLALVLADRAGPDVDVLRAVKAVLVHDIVEIDAGDTYIYDDDGRSDKEEREERAADRLFGLLPSDQRDEFRDLWTEYEERRTPTGRFAYALDRLQPLLLNASSGGMSWTENGVTREQVEAVNRPISEGSAVLWELAEAIIDAAHREGLLA